MEVKIGGRDFKFTRKRRELKKKIKRAKRRTWKELCSKLERGTGKYVLKDSKKEQIVRALLAEVPRPRVKSLSLNWH